MTRPSTLQVQLRRRGLELLPVLAGFALLAALLWRAGLLRVLERLGDLRPAPLVAVLAIMVPVAVAGGLNVWMLFRGVGDIPVQSFLARYWISWAVGLVFPGQVGDVASLAVLLRRYGIELSQSTGISMVDKLISLAVLGAVGTLGLLDSQFERGAWFIGVLLVMLCSGLISLFAASHLPEGRAGLPGRIAGFLRRSTRTCLNYGWQHPGRLAVNAAVTLLKLLLTAKTHQLAFSAVGQDLPYLTVLLCSTTAGLVAYVPVSFNGIGTVEAVALWLYARASVTAPAVLAAYAVLRVIVLLVAWLPVPFLVQRLKQSNPEPAGPSD